MNLLKRYLAAPMAAALKSAALICVICANALCLPSAQASTSFMSAFSLSPSRVNPAQLPLAHAIKTVQGKGQRTLYVLTDPDCPYCRQLEHTLTQLKNVTIYRFEYPITSLHPNASEVARRIWCASNPSAAWDAYEAHHTVPTDNGTCANPIAANIALASRLGLHGTPDLIAGDGRVHEGMMSLDQLETFLGGA